MKKTNNLRYRWNIAWIAALVFTTVLASTGFMQSPGLVPSAASAPLASGVYQQDWYKLWGTGVNDQIKDLARNGTDLFVTGTIYEGFPSYENIFVAKYDSTGSRTLNLKWQTDSNEEARTIVVSAANIYVGGTGVNGGKYSMLVIKFDASGNQVWNKTWINSTYSSAQAEDIKTNGTSVYACGWCFAAPIFSDGLLVKLNGDGSEAWNVTWGGTAQDKFFGMIIDGSIIRVVGLTASVGAGFFDVILVNYDANGHFLNQTIWGTVNSEAANDIIKLNGYLYLAGYQYVNGFGQQALLLKLEPNGTQVWNRTWGSPYAEEARELTSNGTHVFLTGYAGFSGSTTGDQAMFLEYDQAGALLTYKSWGNKNNDDIGNGIAVLGNSVYVAGSNDTGGFITRFSTNPVPATKLLQSWSRGWGSPTMCSFDGIAARGDEVYAVGYTRGTLYDTAVICQYNTNGNLVRSVNLSSSTGYQAGYKVTISGNNVYVAATWRNPGNTATWLQLYKLDSSLNIIWNRTWAPTNTISLDVESIGTDGSNIFVSGSYRAQGMVSTNFDAFVVKYNGDGTQAWNATWGTPKDDHFIKVATDGNLIWLAGYTKDYNTGDFIGTIVCYDASGTFINQTTWGSHTALWLSDATMIGKSFFILGILLTNESQEQLLIAEINRNGTEEWQTTWGLNSTDWPGGITTNGTHLFVDGYQRNPNGTRLDGIFLDLDMNGNVLGTKTWKVGADGDFMNGIACTGGRVYMVGYTDPAITEAWIVKIASYSNPAITNPPNIRYILGSTGNHITWNATDDTTINPWYEVYRNGSLIANTTWTSGVAINVSVDGLEVGTHGYTITIHNGYGHTISDEVLVIVDPSTAPPYTPPSSDLGWIVWIIIICAIGGAIVLLYVLDKKGIINLKPFMQKTRSVAARALVKTRDGFKAIGGKRSSGTPAEKSSSRDDVSEQEMKTTETKTQQQARLENQPEDAQSDVEVEIQQAPAELAVKSVAKPAEPEEEAVEMPAEVPVVKPAKPAKKAAKPAKKAAKPAKKAAKAAVAEPTDDS